MKSRILISALAALIIVLVIAVPAFAAKPPSVWDTIADLDARLDVVEGSYIAAETDPTVASSVKDGVSWSEISSIPADIANGDDGITTETDPTVAASVKDGVSWSELTDKPAGFADGVDNTAGISGWEVTDFSYSISLAAHQRTISTVSPPANKIITGGGGSTNRPDYMRMVKSFPTSTGTWAVEFINDSEGALGNVTITLYAVCVDAPS